MTSDAPAKTQQRVSPDAHTKAQHEVTTDTPELTQQGVTSDDHAQTQPTVRPGVVA